MAKSPCKPPTFRIRYTEPPWDEGLGSTRRTGRDDTWIFCRHLGDSEYGSIFAGLNLAMHEAGHLFFMWFGRDFLAVPLPDCGGDHVP